MQVQAAALPGLPSDIQARVEQMLVHAQDAWLHAKRAKASDRPDERFNALARATDSFDHALIDSKGIPGAAVALAPFYGTYEGTKKALELLVAAGKLNGREKMGTAELVNARNHFSDGIALYGMKAAQSDDVERSRALDLLGHSKTDAEMGVLMTRRADLALPLLKGLGDVYAAVEQGKALKADLVKSINSAFDKVAPESILAAAQPAKGSQPAKA